MFIVSIILNVVWMLNNGIDINNEFLSTVTVRRLF